MEVLRDDDAGSLASINIQLSKLTSSNERISGEVHALKMSPAFAQCANRFLAPFLAIFHAVR